MTKPKSKPCAKCGGFGMVETYDSDLLRVTDAGPAIPAFRYCTCAMGKELKEGDQRVKAHA